MSPSNTPSLSSRTPLTPVKILFSNLKLISRAFEEGLNSGRGVMHLFRLTIAKNRTRARRALARKKTRPRTQMMFLHRPVRAQNRTKIRKALSNSGETQDMAKDG